MQPYQQAGERTKRQGELPFRAAQTAGSLALTAGGSKLAGLALDRVMPLLSKYVPEDLAIKGLNKIDPRFGKFINHAKEEGFDFNEVKDFIEEKATQRAEPLANEEKPKPIFDLNKLKQMAPDLFRRVESGIQQGGSPHEALEFARTNRTANEEIKKIEEEYKTPIFQIIDELFNKGAQAQANPPQQQQPQGGGIDPGVAQLLQQGKEILSRFQNRG